MAQPMAYEVFIEEQRLVAGVGTCYDQFATISSNALAQIERQRGEPFPSIPVPSGRAVRIAFEFEDISGVRHQLTYAFNVLSEREVRSNAWGSPIDIIFGMPFLQHEECSVGFSNGVGKLSLGNRGIHLQACTVDKPDTFMLPPYLDPTVAGNNMGSSEGQQRQQQASQSTGSSSNQVIHPRLVQDRPADVEYVLQFDGGARGNPGIGGAGVVFMYEDGETISFENEYLGNRVTSNQAEYRALIMGLKMARDFGYTDRLIVEGDSELVIKHVTGQFQVRNQTLRRLRKEVFALLENMGDVCFRHIPREQNEKADSLANSAMDTFAPND